MPPPSASAVLAPTRGVPWSSGEAPHLNMTRNIPDPQPRGTLLPLVGMRAAARDEPGRSAPRAGPGPRSSASLWRCGGRDDNETTSPRRRDRRHRAHPGAPACGIRRDPTPPAEDGLHAVPRAWHAPGRLDVCAGRRPETLLAPPLPGRRRRPRQIQPSPRPRRGRPRRGLHRQRLA